MKNITKHKYLVALPCFPGSKGFCHMTILVRAVDKEDCIRLVKHLKPRDNIGEIKRVTI